MVESNHAIDFANAKELIKCPLYIERNIIESSLIQNNFENLLNLSKGMYKIEPIMVNHIVKRFYSANPPIPSDNP